MKYLFIMGPSGSGKTTLAKFLQSSKPDKYKRITQITTRAPREGEVEGNEYFFYTEEQYKTLSLEKGMIAQVKEEFAPGMYGTPISLLDETKMNVVVSSIEGFLDALNKLKPEDKSHVLFIRDVKPEAERPERNYLYEEKYNRIVLHKLQEGQKKFNLIEVTHGYLKRIRNNEILMNRFLCTHKVK